MLSFPLGPKDQGARSLASEPDRRPDVPAGAGVRSHQGPDLSEGDICPGMCTPAGPASVRTGPDQTAEPGAAGETA